MTRPEPDSPEESAFKDAGRSLLMAIDRSDTAEALLIVTDFPEAARRPLEGHFGRTALRIAALDGEEEIALMLIPFSDPDELRGFGPGWGPSVLGCAAKRGLAKLAGALLPHADRPLEAPGKPSPLMLSVIRDSERCFDLLLPHSDPNHQDESGWNALLLAAHYGREKQALAVLPLTEPGALVKMPGGWRGARDLARANGHKDLAERIASFELARAEKEQLSHSLHPAAASAPRPRV